MLCSVQQLREAVPSPGVKGKSLQPMEEQIIPDTTTLALQLVNTSQMNRTRHMVLIMVVDIATKSVKPFLDVYLFY